MRRRARGNLESRSRSNHLRTGKLHKTLAYKFPFLEYSVLSILEHANSAQRAGIDQRAFLSDFPLQRWIFLNNTIEKFAVRRYTQTVTLLYILAEWNLADLIHIHPHLQSWLDVQDERYGPAIFAARATGSHEAARAILQALTHEQPAESSVRGLLERCLKNADNNPTFGRDFTFSRTKGITEHAFEKGDELVLRFLYSLGKVEPAWEEEKDGDLRMRLARAAENGHEGVVRFFLEKSAEVNWKDRIGRTALWEGASGGHEGVVQLLLKNGAEVDSKDNDGRTPLSKAAFKGHEAVVKPLLENRAEVESKDNDGRTPLSWAASGYFPSDVVRLLLSDPRVDPEARDKDGRTPLSWAASDGRQAVFKLLLSDPRVDPEARDKNGQTPLSWARKRER
jgi:ankyrin repeat protein